MKIKILVVANRSPWPSWPEQLKRVADWYRSAAELDFTLKPTDFDQPPFSAYQTADYPGGTGFLGVDPIWYDEKVSPLALGYDVVLLVLPRSQWREPNKARGWRTDASRGPVKLQIGCDENEFDQWPNFPYLPGFFQLARHEIMHALFMITGQPDVTHQWWNLGRLESARDALRFPADWRLPILARAANYVQFLVAKFSAQAKAPVSPAKPANPAPPKTTPLVLWARAIEAYENMGKSYNNPGALRYSPLQSGARNGFSVFRTYEDGWAALLYQLNLAASGKSKIYRPDMSLADFFRLYSPASDGNDPDRYARFVAGRIGVPVETKIGTLV